MPFVAAAYGLLYGRLDVEVTHPRIQLARLPKAFEGFRIAQMSHFHNSPFMTADYIRRCVTIANASNSDLVVLTGDYLADDPTASAEVVQALAGSCGPTGFSAALATMRSMLRNRRIRSLRLFAAERIRILRQERVPIQLHGEVLNLIGVDYQQARFSRDHDGHLVDRYPDGSEKLVMPDMVNILLNHNPNSFDRAADLGVDSDAGRTYSWRAVVAQLHRTQSQPQPTFISLHQRMVRKRGAQLCASICGIGITGFPSGSVPARRFRYLNCLEPDGKPRSSKWPAN